MLPALMPLEPFLRADRQSPYFPEMPPGDHQITVHWGNRVVDFRDLVVLPSLFYGLDNADVKAEKLLREWLSPAQLAQFDREMRFDVIGCDTGRRYRINYGAAVNVDQLDRRSRVVRRWCFSPQGVSARGDVMLAQKIMLETRERWALRKAFHYPPDPDAPAGYILKSFLREVVLPAVLGCVTGAVIVASLVAWLGL